MRLGSIPEWRGNPNACPLYVFYLILFLYDHVEQIVRWQIFCTLAFFPLQRFAGNWVFLADPLKTLAAFQRSLLSEHLCHDQIFWWVKVRTFKNETLCWSDGEIGVEVRVSIKLSWQTNRARKPFREYVDVLLGNTPPVHVFPLSLS